MGISYVIQSLLLRTNCSVAPVNKQRVPVLIVSLHPFLAREIVVHDEIRRISYRRLGLWILCAAATCNNQSVCSQYSAYHSPWYCTADNQQPIKWKILSSKSYHRMLPTSAKIGHLYYYDAGFELWKKSWGLSFLAVGVFPNCNVNRACAVCTDPLSPPIQNLALRWVGRENSRGIQLSQLPSNSNTAAMLERVNLTINPWVWSKCTVAIKG